MNEFCTFFIPELKKVKINDIEAVPLATTAAPIGRGVLRGFKRFAERTDFASPRGHYSSRLPIGGQPKLRILKIRDGGKSTDAVHRSDCPGFEASRSTE